MFFGLGESLVTEGCEMDKAGAKKVWSEACARGGGGFVMCAVVCCSCRGCVVRLNDSV